MTRYPDPLWLPDADATDRVGAALGAALRPGDCVLLEGPLGAGKSALARAAIRALAGASTEVPSPTFTLVQTYEAGGVEVWHADLYRLGTADEVVELGLDTAFAEAICLVEWPERLGPWRPARALTLRLGTEPARDGPVRDGPVRDGRWLAPEPEGPGWAGVLAAMAAAAGAGPT